jgi:pimeloyl-[acyl-carrier protein] synthase
LAAAIIDLSSYEFLMDPYGTYRELRERPEPYWLPNQGRHGGTWLFTRYDDVVTILKEARLSRWLSREPAGESATPFERSMLYQDPPAHTRLRGLVSKAFTSNRIKGHELRIAAIANELIDRIEKRGAADFVADFAEPLTSTVIAGMLGVPPSDRALFGEWSRRVATNFDSVRASSAIATAAAGALQELAQYFARLIVARRKEPQDDLISALVAARDVQDQLSEEELLGSCMLLLMAGTETTIRLVGNGLLTLLRSPEQLAQLKKDSTLMASAVEELLRFESPVQRAGYRVTRERLEIGSATVEGDQLVTAMLGAANRDPAQFPDPEMFDVRREPNRHLAFGSGIHFCLGAALARAEARIGLGEVLRRLPGIRLIDERPDWSPNTLFRGLGALPVGV